MVTDWGCNYTENVILRCTLCLFKLGFNHVMWSAYFNFTLKSEDAESILAKKFSSHKFLQAEFSNNCLKIWYFLSVTKFSLILVSKWRLVSPIEQHWHPAHTNLYTTKDFRPLSKQPLTDMLNLVIPTEYCTKDSFSFCKEIQEVITSMKFMISYDICSLFTSISLKETIDIAANLIFDKFTFYGFNDLVICCHRIYVKWDFI